MDELLIQAAREARENAFALKSEHKIGAAVLTSKGNIYGGCNIESNVSGLGQCAERCAINHAIAHGEYRFKKLVIYDEKLIVPCGACLQYLLEFQPLQDTAIISACPDKIQPYLLLDLIPHGYISPRAVEKVSNYIK